jgi:hypothetical protein
MAAPEHAHPHDLVVFEDRLILEARAPITQDEIAAIEARCAGPIPPGLRALWRLSFGGRVDYSLSVDYGEVVHSFSFTELFYPGSDHYFDLWGWIDREAELAEEAADERGETWSGKLAYLPFGGFEYLERLYVCTQPGPDYGSVIAYAQGLGPAWTLRLHETSVARIADDVPAVFRMLDLEQDPADPGADEFGPGHEMLAAIEAVGETDPAQADRLTALMRSAVVDWRAALAQGRLAQADRPRRLALRHAATTGDIDLLARLAAAGCDLNEAFGGGGGALDHALAHGHLAAGRWLVDQGVDVTDAVNNAASQLPAPFVADLLARGARPTAVAASAAARAERMDSAALIVDALAQADPQAVRDLIGDLARWAGDADASAARIEAGTLGSNLTPAEYRSEGDRMRALRDHCQSLLGPPPTPPSRPPPWRRLFGGAR